MSTGKTMSAGLKGPWVLADFLPCSFWFISMHCDWVIHHDWPHQALYSTRGLHRKLPTTEAVVRNFMPEPEYLFDVCLHFTGLKSLVINGGPVLTSHFFIFPSPLLPFDLPSFTCLSLLPWLISLLIFLAWKCGPIFSGFTNSPVSVSFFRSSPSHQAQTTCWDHPKMTELYQALGEWEDN